MEDGGGGREEGGGGRGTLVNLWSVKQRGVSLLPSSDNEAGAGWIGHRGLSRQDECR